MNERQQARLAYHGALMLLVGLLCGVLAVTEPEGKPMPSWQAAHGGLLLNGVWLLAAAGLAGRLVLDEAGSTALFWALLGMAYAFLETVLIQASTGTRGLDLSGGLAGTLAFGGNLAVVLCSVVAASLLLMGAHNWVRRTAPVPAVASD